MTSARVLWDYFVVMARLGGPLGMAVRRANGTLSADIPAALERRRAERRTS